MRLIFRANASADLRGIARETRAVWDDEQAKRYVAKLRSEINALKKFPLRYAEVEERPNLRRMNSGRHAVFYVVGEKRIEIVRILHVSRDAGRWI